MLTSVAWMIRHLMTPFFYIAEVGFSVRKIILILGGLFLLAKSTSEIHHKMEGTITHFKEEGKSSSLKVVMQIVVLNIVFSFDSILTAIGLTGQLIIMIIAVVISIINMMLFHGKSVNSYQITQPWKSRHCHF